MKHFLPANCFTTLLEKPPETDVERRRLWVKDSRKISLVVEEQTMTFIQDYHATVKQKPLGLSILKKSKTFAVRKYLRGIPVHSFPPLLVDDRISQSTPYVFNNVDLQHFHKSLE